MKTYAARGKNLVRLLKREKVPVGVTPARVVWRRNKLELLRYERPGGTARDAAPLLLVPSLINQHYILDLQPGKSLVEFLLGQGFDVFMITWGRPGPEDRFLSFDQHIQLLLGGAIRQVRSMTGRRSIHLLGYCVGGLLATIYTALHPGHAASLVNLAVPIDFHCGGTLAAWTDRRTFDVDALVDSLGNVPWPLMQLSFHLLKPTAQATKVVYLVDRLWDDRFLDSFIALETWAGDNVSFPGECYRKYIRDLYQENALVRGELTIAERKVDLAAITCPLLSAAAREDHIVPLESALAIGKHVPHAKEIIMEGGHIGAVVGFRASTTLWPAVRDFLLETGSPV
ncbi:MAG: alpha/beta fold hydrolase [Pseudomonadota bacterium]